MKIYTVWRNDGCNGFRVVASYENEEDANIHLKSIKDCITNVKSKPNACISKNDAKKIKFIDPTSVIEVGENTYQLGSVEDYFIGIREIYPSFRSFLNTRSSVE